MTVTPHPEYAPWLAALAAEPRDPVIVYKESEFVLEVAGTALVRSPAYAKLAVALTVPTAEQATREKVKR